MGKCVKEPLSSLHSERIVKCSGAPLVSASPGSREADQAALLLKLAILKVVQTCDDAFCPQVIMLWMGITDLHALCHIFSTFTASVYGF